MSCDLAKPTRPSFVLPPSLSPGRLRGCHRRASRASRQASVAAANALPALYSPVRALGSANATLVRQQRPCSAPPETPRFISSPARLPGSRPPPAGDDAIDTARVDCISGASARTEAAAGSVSIARSPRAGGPSQVVSGYATPVAAGSRVLWSSNNSFAPALTSPTLTSGPGSPVGRWTTTTTTTVAAPAACAALRLDAPGHGQMVQRYSGQLSGGTVPALAAATAPAIRVTSCWQQQPHRVAAPLAAPPQASAGAALRVGAPPMLGPWAGPQASPCGAGLPLRRA